jgi:HD-GYP domain-containing protein (c-di-GMP phosphodiesterase class II)
MGAEDYLVKPVTRHELLTSLRSRLERSNQLQVAQLEKAYESTLIVLANAIEVRDNPTYKHVERVRDHALVIAQALGWTSGHQSYLEYGSILHDIGKIQISDQIIKKQGPLDQSEWIEMKKHPLIGEEMIKNIPFLAPAMPVVRHHHERFDGSGYPDGLAGEAIPLAARIVAVADALDAMTLAFRPYRRPFTAAEAYQEVLRCSGTHFDPMVVRAFQRVWDKIAPRLE